MHLYLLENPSAGRSRDRSFLDALTRAFAAKGHDLTTYVGGEPGALAEHAATLPVEGIDAVLVAGGDGTIRSILNARPEPPPWPLGVVPIGTANLVARETRVFGVRQPEKLVAALLEAERWPVDLLQVRRGDGEPELAISSVGIGLDGELVHAVSRIRGAAATSGGYRRWLEPAWSALREYPFLPLTLTLDGGRVIESPLAVLQNAHSYGGFFTLSPEASLDSGRIEVVTVNARTNRDLIRVAIKAGSRSLHRDRGVRIEPAQSVRVRAPEPVAVQADGDPAGHTDLEVTLRPKAVRLLRARGR